MHKDFRNFRDPNPRAANAVQTPQLALGEWLAFNCITHHIANLLNFCEIDSSPLP
jgi:hypothetical protein